jgi:hypothetical protein
MKLIKLPSAANGPVLSDKITKEAGFVGFDISAPPEHVIAKLHHTIEAQRHDDAHEHLIGGYAELTTVTPTGIAQRILTRWNDEIDEPIKLEPRRSKKPQENGNGRQPRQGGDRSSLAQQIFAADTVPASMRRKGCGAAKSEWALGSSGPPRAHSPPAPSDQQCGSRQHDPRDQRRRASKH